MKYPEEFLRERIELLEEALKFYANKNNWEYHFPSQSKIDDDGGKIAREALLKGRP